ncbi:hypothetical protein GCM10022631_04570 [Deinococcus rubellus]|uniref:PD-(D/E)XK nuclease family protein n=1 Tax=Deinococcus rubellus TaxID=1889240 RepID=UPI0031EDAEDA
MSAVLVRLLVTSSDASLRLETAAQLLQLQGPFTLVVPNVPAGRSVRARLGDHLRAHSLTQLARERLRAGGWRPLKPGERDAFLRRALADTEFQYLTPLMERPSTWSSLSRTLSELLRADVEPQAVLSVAQGAREADVAQAFDAYVATCVRERRFDMSGTEYFARRYALGTPLRALVHGFTHLDASQIAFLGALLAPGSALTLPDPDERRLHETRRTAQAFQAMGFVTEHLPAAPHPAEASTISVHSAPDVESEVRAALRQVRAWLAAGAAPHQLGVVLRDEATYLPALIDVAREYGLPLTGHHQLPLLRTAVGALVWLWLEALEGDWTFSRTRALLTHPLCGLPGGSLEVARRLSPVFPAGLEAWHPDLAWLELPPEESLSGAVGRLERFLHEAGVMERCRTDTALNAHTASLVEALSGAAQDHALRPRQDVTALLRHTLSTHTTPLLLGRGGVRVINPLGLLGCQFQKLWVLGLADGLYPPRVSESPLLDSAVRARWSEAGVLVPDASTSTAVEETIFHGAVLSSAQALVLSSPRRTAQGRALMPSVFLTRLGTLPAWSSGVPLASEGEQLLERALNAGEVPETVRRAAQIEQGRDAGQPSAHHGLLGESLWDPTWTWSASQLHDVGACRFRWFGRKALGLREDADPEAGEDRRVTGTLLHAALEGALRGWTPQDPPALLLERAEAALDRAILRERHAGNFHPGPLFEIERREWGQTVQQALQSPDFLPEGWIPDQSALEGSFDQTLAVGEVVFRLRGVVDRVDHSPVGKLVTDYKVGTYISTVQPDAQEAGKLNLEIQLPLYMRALGAVGGRYFSIEGSNVIGAAGQLNTKRTYDAAEHASALDTFLLGVHQDLEAGQVTPRPDQDGKACGFCTVGPVCRHPGGRA